MFRIRDWDEHFENNRTRDLKRLNWVPFPNKHDGDGYTALLDHPEGASHYGCWCAIVQVASKCDPRGTLVRDGARPHDSRSLGRMTKISEKVLKAAIERLVHEIEWLEIIPDPNTEKQLALASHDDVTKPHSCAVLGPQESASLLNGMEGNGMEGKYSSEPESQAAEQQDSILSFQTVGTGQTEWNLTQALLDEFVEAYPGIDVMAQIRKAKAWIVSNPGKRKTPRGMPKFLNGWLEKATNRGGNKNVTTSGSLSDLIP